MARGDDAGASAAQRTPANRRHRAAQGVALMFTIILFAGLGLLPAAADTSGGANHVVTALATAADPTVTNSGVQISSVGAPSVTSANIARASSEDCTGCRAAAAAFQAVFITGQASTIRPENVAVATNVNCNHCDSFAFAYQYVLTTTGPVYLNGDARQQIAQLRQQLASETASGLPDEQINTDLWKLAYQFKAIIDRGVQQAGIGAQGTANERVDSAPAL
jgi:hypothetical protein